MPDDPIKYNYITIYDIIINIITDIYMYII